MDKATLGISTDVLSGTSAGTSLGEVLRGRAIHSVLIVSGSRTEQLRLADEVRAGLDAAGVTWELVMRRERFAMMSDVEVMAQALRTAQHGAVVGIGGGSAIDLAKVAAIVAAEGSPAEQHAVRFTPPDTVVIPELRARKVPVVAIPTMFSGSEGNGSGQIRGGKERFARSFRDDTVTPSIVVLDPLAGEGQSPKQAISTGLNALANCINGLYTKMRSPFSDGLAAEGTRLLFHALPQLVHDASVPVPRLEAQWGSLLSGMVIRHAFGAMHHAVSHSLVNRAGFDHAYANAMILPHSVSWHVDNLEGADADRLCNALPRGWRETLRELTAAVGLPASLREAGIEESLLGDLAHEAAHERAVANELVPIGENVLQDVLRRAYNGD